MCVLCVSQVHKVHVCVFLASLFLLSVCFVCVSLCLCIFGLFSFIISYVCALCVTLVHKVHAGVFLASLVLLYVCIWPVVFNDVCCACVAGARDQYGNLQPLASVLLAVTQAVVNALFVSLIPLLWVSQYL